MYNISNSRMSYKFKAESAVGEVKVSHGLGFLQKSKGPLGVWPQGVGREVKVH